jgi:hypothetical protein
MTNKRITFGSTPAEFASFGKQAFAYMRPVQSDEMNAKFPQNPQLPSGLDLWGLFGADGEPLALADERQALLDNADELDLMPLARH